MLNLWFYRLLFLIFSLSTSGLSAKPISIRNVKVDVTGKTALQARDTAMNKARQIAFAKLAAEYPEFGINIQEGVPPDNILEGLVIDYEVAGEKMSAVRYIGIFNFNFNDRALRKYLSGSHRLVKPSSDTSSEGSSREEHSSRYVIIPIYISPDTSYLWEESNPWSHYWISQETKTKGKISGHQFVMPLRDLRDMTEMTIEDALTSKTQPLSAMMERYQGRVLIVILKSLDDGVNSHELQVKIYTRSGGIQDSYEPITLQGQKGVTLTDVFKNAVQKSFALVANKGNIEMSTSIEPTFDAQTDQSLEARAPSSVKVVVTFNGFQDWQAIRQALNKNDFIDDFDVLNLNREQAEIQIRSRVPAAVLKEKLAQIGLRLDSSRDKPSLKLSPQTHSYQKPLPPRVPSPFSPSPDEDEIDEVTEEMDDRRADHPPEVIE